MSMWSARAPATRNRVRVAEIDSHDATVCPLFVLADHFQHSARVAVSAWYTGTHKDMSSDTVSEIRTTTDGVATEIPPTTSAPPNTETELSQPKLGSPSKRVSKLSSPLKQLSRRFTSKRVVRVRQEKFSNDSVRGDSFTLFILQWVPHAAVLIIVISMVAMAFMQAPTSNPRESEQAWLRRPIQWGETQNMWMPFYSFFAMLMTLLFFHSFVRIAIVAEVHCALHRAHPHAPSPVYHSCACGNLADANFERARAAMTAAGDIDGKSREAGAPAVAAESTSAAKPLLRQETKWLAKAITQDKLLAKATQVIPLGVPQEKKRRICGWCGWWRGGMRRGEWWRWWARGALPQLQTDPGGEVTMIRAAETFAPSEVVLWLGFLLAYVLRTIVEVLCHLRADGEGPEMGFTGELVGEYLAYCFGIAIVARLCVGLRVAVLQREAGGSNSESSMRAYLLRGSLKVRIFACLAVQLFCVFYTGMHAKVSPYYVYPLATMSNPVLTSPVLNPCILTNTTYVQTYCERSPRLEGAEFSCNTDGGWYTYPSAYDACIAARLQNGYQSNGWSAFMVSVNVLLFVVLYEIRVTRRVGGGTRPKRELCEDLLVALAACGWYAMPPLTILGSQGIFARGPTPSSRALTCPALGSLCFIAILLVPVGLQSMRNVQLILQIFNFVAWSSCFFLYNLDFLTYIRDVVARGGKAPPRFDVFLSHNWSEGTHEKMVTLKEALVARGLTCFLDQDNFDRWGGGGDLPTQMTQAMDRSSLFLCTINKDYLDKIDGKGKLGQRDNCKFEFTCIPRDSNPRLADLLLTCLGLALDRRDQPNGDEARGAACHKLAVHRPARVAWARRGLPGGPVLGALLGGKAAGGDCGQYRGACAALQVREGGTAALHLLPTPLPRPPPPPNQAFRALRAGGR